MYNIYCMSLLISHIYPQFNLIDITISFLYLADWTQLNSFCLHIKVLSIAMRNFDAMFSISPAFDQETADEGV